MGGFGLPPTLTALQLRCKVMRPPETARCPSVRLLSLCPWNANEEYMGNASVYKD